MGGARRRARAPGLRCVYVASDTPFVDRSFADAAALAAQDSHFSHTWPARGGELMRLFQRIGGLGGGGQRRAFLLSGGTPCTLQNGARLAAGTAGERDGRRAAGAAPAPRAPGPAAAPAADPRVRPRDGFFQRPV